MEWPDPARMGGHRWPRRNQARRLVHAGRGWKACRNCLNLTTKGAPYYGTDTHTHDCIHALYQLDISPEDAYALRRIAMQLHRWHELECGIDSGGVERDEQTGKVTWYNAYTGARTPFPDRETPTLKRPAKIMERYPTLKAYVQGDPRGAALYILRPGDVPEGADADAYYSRGVAVYK